MSIRPSFMCSFLICSLLLQGCQSIGLLNHKPSIPLATERNPVVEMICLWEAAEGVGTDGMPTRGFAGQILFFTADDKEPVQMNGDIRIYVFDDLGTEEEQSKPLHQFDFDSPSFQTFLHDTNLGGAYQLFIPYTRKGRHKTTCSLRVRLTPPEGQALYSKIASVILPGTTDQEPKSISSSSDKPLRTIEQMGHNIVVNEREQLSSPGVEVQQSTARRDRQALQSRLADITADAGNLPKPEGQSLKEQPAKLAADHPLLSD